MKNFAQIKLTSKNLLFFTIIIFTLFSLVLHTVIQSLGIESLIMNNIYDRTDLNSMSVLIYILTIIIGPVCAGLLIIYKGLKYAVLYIVIIAGLIILTYDPSAFLNFLTRDIAEMFIVQSLIGMILGLLCTFGYNKIYSKSV